MSVRQLTAVFERSQSRGMARLVLVALADCADNDGICWPSLPTLAKKAAVDRATVIRHLAGLEKAGELSVQRIHGRGNRYRITIGPVAECDPSQPATSRTLPRDQSHPCNGYPSQPATQSVSRTVKNRNEARRRCRLPDDFLLSDGRRAYASGKGLGPVEAEFEKFRAFHGAKGSVMLDWDKAWQTWVLNAVGRFAPRLALTPKPNGRRLEDFTGRGEEFDA